jgi:hypothetical protein
MWLDTKGSTVLGASECLRLLAMAARDTGFGRLGISTPGAPIILPVNFSLVEHHVLVRVGNDTFSHEAPGRLVAFEVDHVNASVGMAWSVLVRGLASVVEDPDASTMAAAPVPFVHDPGETLITVRPDVITGRRFEIDPTPDERRPNRR